MAGRLPSHGACPRPYGDFGVSEPIRFGAALVSVFVSRAVGGAVVSLLIATIPFYNHPAAYDGWSRYVVGFSLAACFVGALFMPLVVRLFRYEISVAAAFVALFAGVLVANLFFGVLVSTNGRSPYWSLPLATALNPIGSVISLLVSAWVVCEVSSRRHRSAVRQSESGPIG